MGGYARMLNPVGSSKKTHVFPGYGRAFDVCWLRLDDIDFSEVASISNPWNENKSVKISRDGQELPNAIGRKICEMVDLRVYRGDPIGYKTDTNEAETGSAFLNNNLRPEHPPPPPMPLSDGAMQGSVVQTSAPQCQYEAVRDPRVMHVTDMMQQGYPGAPVGWNPWGMPPPMAWGAPPWMRYGSPSSASSSYYFSSDNELGEGEEPNRKKCDRKEERRARHRGKGKSHRQEQKLRIKNSNHKKVRRQNSRHHSHTRHKKHHRRTAMQTGSEGMPYGGFAHSVMQVGPPLEWQGACPVGI